MYYQLDDQDAEFIIDTLTKVVTQGNLESLEKYIERVKRIIESLKFPVKTHEVRDKSKCG